MADGWSWYLGGDYDAWKTTPPDEEEDCEPLTLEDRADLEYDKLKEEGP